MQSEWFDAVVLDADAASFLVNQDRVRDWRYRRHTVDRTIYLPFVVAAEMLFGAERRHWGPARRAQLQHFIDDCVMVESAEDITHNWVIIKVESELAGLSMANHDAWIAAVAITLDVPLVTHNASDFAHVPLLKIITEPDL